MQNWNAWSGTVDWGGVIVVFVPEQHPNIGQSVILSHTNIFYVKTLLTN